MQIDDFSAGVGGWATEALRAMGTAAWPRMPFVMPGSNLLLIRIFSICKVSSSESVNPEE